jgi:ribosomal-protein-alanine N-acetyltransferase
MHVPSILTKRLSLRAIKFADTDAIRRIIGIDPNSADAYIERILEPDHPKCYVWAIDYEKETVGTICFWNIQDDYAQIGYDIDPAFQGRGFATEAGFGILGMATSFGFKTLDAYCQPGNLASQHVARHLGFTFTRTTGVFNIYTKKV